MYTYLSFSLSVCALLSTFTCPSVFNGLYVCLTGYLDMCMCLCVWLYACHAGYFSTYTSMSTCTCVYVSDSLSVTTVSLAVYTPACNQVMSICSCVSVWLLIPVPDWLTAHTSCSYINTNSPLISLPMSLTYIKISLYMCQWLWHSNISISFVTNNRITFIYYKMLFRHHTYQDPAGRMLSGQTTLLLFPSYIYDNKSKGLSIYACSAILRYPLKWK